MRTKVKYNNRNIVFTDGAKIVLLCKGRYMPSDVVVSFDDETTGSVSYNGKVTDAAEGQVITVECEGAKMLSDVVINVPAIGGEDPSLERLPAPTIILDGDILTIYDESGLAEIFDIYADGELVDAALAEHRYILDGYWVLNKEIDLTTMPSASYNLQNCYVTADGNVSQGGEGELLTGEYPFGDVGTLKKCLIIRLKPTNTATIYHGTSWDYGFFGGSKVIIYSQMPSNLDLRGITFSKQEVSEEFYNWFTANAEHYMPLKAGTYRFKDTLEFPTEHDGAYFDFVFAGARSAGMFYRDGGTLEYHSSLSTTKTTAYSDGAWTDDAYRMFAIENDVVMSEALYTWITTNTEYTEGLLTTYSGARVFYDTDLETCPSRASVRFTSAGVLYTDIGVSANKLVYSNPGEQVYVYDYSTGLWSDEAYRTIEFDGQQVLPLEVFDWIDRNSVIKLRTLSGTWVFDEKPNGWKDYNVKFTSNGESFSKMYIEDDGRVYYSLSTGVNETYVYNSSDEVWENQDYRIIAFEGAQPVRKEFYKWFTANATQYYDDEAKAIRGNWQFNDTITIPDDEYEITVPFTSYGYEFGGIKTHSAFGSSHMLYQEPSSILTRTAYKNDGWEESGYQFLTFSTDGIWVPVQYSDAGEESWLLANAKPNLAPLPG